MIIADSISLQLIAEEGKLLSVGAFIVQRRAGAEKIAKSARVKGGLSILTAVHFESKLPMYSTILGLCTSSPAGQVLATLKGIEKSLSAQILTAADMETFQALTGKQEVVGEVICYLEHPKVYA